MKRNLSSGIKLMSVVIIMMFSNYLNAQTSTRDSLFKIYNTQTIHSLGKFYVQESKQLKLADLKSEMTSPLTKILYKKSRGNLAAANLLTIAAIGGLVTGSIIKKNNNGAGIVLNIGAVVLNRGGMHLRKKFTEIIDRAIWQRNKEVLFS